MADRTCLLIPAALQRMSWGRKEEKQGGQLGQPDGRPGEEPELLRWKEEEERKQQARAVRFECTGLVCVSL